MNAIQPLYILLICIALLFQSGFAQQQFCYKSAKGGRFTSIIQSNDGGYLLTKLDEVVKMDAAFNIVWSKTINGTFSSKMRQIVETPTGDIYVGGSRKLSILGKADIMVIKLDALGNEIWIKTIGGSETEGLDALAYTSDGGCIATGFTRSYGFGAQVFPREAYVIKYDAAGNVMWTHIMGKDEEHDGTTDIIETLDGNYVYAGYMNSEPVLVKLNTTGNVVFTKELMGMEDANFAGITELASGELICTGGGEPVPGVDDYILLTSISADGTTVNWAKLYGNAPQDFGNTVINTSDGGFAVTGLSQSFGAGVGDVYLMKTDATGNLEWDVSFGGPGSDRGMDLVQTPDNGFFVVASLDGDSYFLKTDDKGQNCCSNPAGVTVTDMTLTMQDVTASTTSAGIEGTWGNISNATIVLEDVCPPCQPTDSTFDAVACLSYTVPSGDETYVVGGTYEDTLTNAQGCDSILTINLSFGGAVHNQSLTECDSAAINGTWYYTTQMISDTFPGAAAGGCDSIVNTSLTVLQGQQTTDDVVACLSDFPVVVHGISRAVPGVYTASFTGRNGCDSISRVTLQGDEVTHTLTYSDCDSVEVEGVWHYSSTMIRDTIFGGTSNNCDSIVIRDIQITPSPSLVISSSAEELVSGNNVTLTASGAVSYEWNTGSVSPVITVTPSSTISYCVTGRSADGLCSDLLCQEIGVRICEQGEVFVPGGISPNGDGINDDWCIYGLECISELGVRIYDRWGNEVYFSEDRGGCWDGTYKGKSLNNGVFIYHLEVLLITGEQFSSSGNISLIR